MACTICANILAPTVTQTQFAEGLVLVDVLVVFAIEAGSTDVVIILAISAPWPLTTVRITNFLPLEHGTLNASI